MRGKTLVIAALVLLVPVSGLLVGFSVGPPGPVVRWEGPVNADLLSKVRLDLANARLSRDKFIRVYLMSPGGSVPYAVEIINEMQAAKYDGVTIEIHGSGMIASAATFILGSGSKGKRYVRGHVLALVHGVQAANVCVPKPTEIKTEEDKVLTAIYDVLERIYMDATGKSRQTVMLWLACGNEQAGDGQLLIALGLADGVSY